MVDRISSVQRSQLMASVRSGNTTPEMAVRRFLHHRGFRYRLHDNRIPGRPDIVLPKFGYAIWVHGCFWHSCPHCPKGNKKPKTNVDFWAKKLERNHQRDGENLRDAKDLGWDVLVIWECQTKNENRLAEALGPLLSKQQAYKTFT
jgi:DNA mismatch endonuclease, patch repair protein